MIDSYTYSAEHAALVRALAPRSVVSTPLIARDHVRGVISVVYADSGRRYDDVDRMLIEELARRAAIAIDNARLYEAERQARAEAEMAVQTRDVFLSVAAHELKTPLTSLLGNAQLLQRRTTRESLLKPREQHSLHVIVEQANRLNRMIMALLDITRLEQGQLNIERVPVDLGKLVQRIVAETQPMLERHTIVYTDPGIPLVVEGDALRLEQVLQNLIQNAVKYSPTGGEVRIDVAERHGMAVVEVTDQGMGIPQTALPQLFQRFYRAPNVDPKNISGMGIGLYVVKEIIALHGGRVDVVSQEGHGSTFSVCLPLQQHHT